MPKKKIIEDPMTRAKNVLLRKFKKQLRASVVEQGHSADGLGAMIDIAAWDLTLYKILQAEVMALEKTYYMVETRDGSKFVTYPCVDKMLSSHKAVIESLNAIGLTESTIKMDDGSPTSKFLQDFSNKLKNSK